jgi:hypothetical protein
MSRTLFFAVIITLSALTYGCGDDTAAQKTEQQNSNQIDVAAVKNTFAQMNTIENKIGEEQNKFGGIMTKMMAKKHPSKSEIENLNSEFKSSLSGVMAAVDESPKINPPKLSNPDAQRYITEAVDLHKKRSIMITSKFSSLMSGEVDQAMSMNTQIDNLAMQEAVSLKMAFDALGVEPDSKD